MDVKISLVTGVSSAPPPLDESGFISVLVSSVPRLFFGMSRNASVTSQKRLDYNHGTIIPHHPQRNDEGAKEQKTRHFGIIEMGGGVVQMFHLFCPRL